jgi:mannitol/fructose-specific phosphotransferase system IIA component
MSSMRRDLLGQWLGHLVVRPHGVDEAQRPALLAGAVVRQHQHQGVVELAAGLEVIATAGPSCWSA